MSFNGFSSISAYEAECRRIGFTTKRIPYRRGDQDCFLLITSPPQALSGVSSWHLFTADENKELLSGVISGTDVNYTGKLSANGFFPADQPAPASKIIPFPTQSQPDDLRPGSQISLF